MGVSYAGWFVSAALLTGAMAQKLKTPASRAQQPFEMEENVIFIMINKYNYNQTFFP
jgi:hypothetical protein